MDQDYVWVFWEVNLVTENAGNITIHARATAEDGSVQPPRDQNYLDGRNSYPEREIIIEEGI